MIPAIYSQNARNYQLSSSCDAFSDSSGSEVDVTNLSVTIVCNGVSPVILGLTHDGSANTGFIFVQDTAGAAVAARMIMRFKEGSTVLAEEHLFIQQTSTGADELTSHLRLPFGSFSHFMLPSAGSHTYKVSIDIDVGDLAGIERAKMYAIEL